MVEVPVDSPGQIAFQAASNFAVGFALRTSFFDVGAGFEVMACAMHGDDLDGSVESAVASAVESVSHGVT